MTDAADLDRSRRRQGTRRSRTRWGNFLHQVRLHRPQYLSLVDTLGQPLVRSNTGRRKVASRFAFLTAVSVLLVLVLITLPRPSFQTPPSTTPPDLTSPDAATYQPQLTSAPSAPHLVSPVQAPLTRAATTAPVPAPPTTKPPKLAASSTLAPLQGCPTIKVLPTAIRIPAIAVSSSDVAPLGLNPDHTMAVPPLNKVDQLGWYSCSPVPGDDGPSVVVAHVDGNGKLGLFAKLDQLQPGDEVEIDRSDGQTATFRVTHAEQVPKTQFPTSAVYSNTPGAQLRLITCTGTVDKVHKRYLDQEIVFAQLISLQPSVD